MLPVSAGIDRLLMPHFLNFLPNLLEGAAVTVAILLLATVLAVIFAFAAGLARLSGRSAVRIPAVMFVEFFRGTSALVQLFWIYFVLPFFGIHIPAMAAAVVALGLNTGAYGAEIVRGAVLAVPKGQYEVATAFNFSPYKRMRYIILPQAIPAMIPAFGNLLIELLKATSLVSLITVGDITYKSILYITNTMKITEIFIVILLVYFFLAQIITFLMKKIELQVTHGLDYGGIQ
ncbi:MAG TPA: ectoine/hydroxyectoine ABC transporter permease subunit EhuC [Spirochaetota bacterium]|mgnify:CR=1 FL=1|nr:ectoine/hydroxyectoine ABC transporter permease subunit EhuC [Spirochaetota bacterium]HPJ37059.1 ectoine/hydroxyectoine ABC transporter permease subunit EhuC [Spirochaetota bacterium]